MQHATTVLERAIGSYCRLRVGTYRKLSRPVRVFYLESANVVLEEECDGSEVRVRVDP